MRRDLAPPARDRLWVADLSEIATWEGKLYLAVAVDCFSHRCVGWAMAEHMRAELVVEALEMALWQLRPDIGLVHHSDINLVSPGIGTPAPLRSDGEWDDEVPELAGEIERAHRVTPPSRTGRAQLICQV